MKKNKKYRIRQRESNKGIPSLPKCPLCGTHLAIADGIPYCPNCAWDEYDERLPLNFGEILDEGLTIRAYYRQISQETLTNNKQ